MRKVSNWLLIVLVCVSITSISESSSQQNVEKQFDVNPGGKLNLELSTGGSVEIRGWNKNRVDVKAKLGGKHWMDCEVEIFEKDGDVTVESRYVGERNSHSTSFEFLIMVPEKFNVELSSAGGEITIENLEGSVEGSTGGGEIQISDAKGTVELSTGGGEIHVRKSELDGRVSTGGGEIILDEVKGDLEGSSGSGKVIRTGSSHRHNSAFSKHDKHSGLEITKGGGEVEIDEAPNGVRISTGGGDIRVGSADHFVEAHTGGGDIDLEAVNGSVEATTGAGNVSVRITGEANNGGADVQVASGSGDITVMLPSNFSAEIQAEIGYTHERESFRIRSDFPLNIKQLDEWDTREGTARKYIRGTGTLAEGKNRIRIKTVNGSIILKKS